MAYVAISNQLCEDVARLIRNKRAAEANLIPIAQLHFIQPDDPRLIAKFWGDHAHLRDLMPPEWCVKVDNLSFVTDYEQVPGDPHSTRTLSVTANIVGGVVLAPPRTDTYYPKIKVPPDAPEIADFVRRAVAEYEVNAKWTKVNNDVVKFLRSSKSLNEALKLWPDLRIYIPQNYIDRMGVKYDKQTKAESKAMEILKQIDTDGAVASAVTLRLLQATPQEAA